MIDPTLPDDPIRALLHEHYRSKGQFYCRLAYSFVRCWDIAQELCHDAFAKAWEKRNDIRDWQALGGWLATVVTNGSIRHIARQRHERRLLREKVLPREETKSAMNEIDDRDAAMHALDQLPENLRAVVALRSLKGMSNEEVASLLSLTYGQAAQRYHRGIEFMRERVFRESEPTESPPTILKFKAGEPDRAKMRFKP